MKGRGFGRRRPRAAQSLKQGKAPAKKVSAKKAVSPDTSDAALVLDEPNLEPDLDQQAAPALYKADTGTEESVPIAGPADGGMEAVKDDDGEGQVSEGLRSRVQAKLLQRADVTILARLPRGDLAREVGVIINEILEEMAQSVDELTHRNLVTMLVQGILGESSAGGPVKPEPEAPMPASTDADDILDEDIFEAAKAALDNERSGTGKGAKSPVRSTIQNAKDRIQAVLMERIDVTAASQLPRKELADQISDVVVEILGEMKIQLNLIEQRDLVSILLNDMLGLGPLEPLLADEKVTDIMVNGPDQVYVESGGKLVLTDVHFHNNAHVMNIATRIVSRVGRRIDESQPLVDARLEDGSRVNIIAPPLAIDGTSISIRKFAKQGITLDLMAKQGNLSEPLAKLLKIASRCRLNILISGGTGSGKTTLLNALSRLIDNGERIVTIEDAAELQLQQPHVVRLETRPPNLEGTGEITMRDLLKNALRMRPDRVILGEIRGSEALDMLQAMNTGHDGSMSTVHANNPREALTRLENMVAMAGVNLPAQAVRAQIASAIHLIVQISRMRDGMRRIISVAEVTGMEGEIITSQELFAFQYEGEGSDGKLNGSFRSAGLRPTFLERAEYFGLGQALMETVS